MMSPEHEQITRLLNQSVDRLYIELAEGSIENAGVLFSEAQAKDTGKGIFQRIRGKLAEEICVKWKFCAKRDDPRYGDAVTLVSSAADIVSTAVTGVPPFVVGSLLVKIGLGKFCSCDDAGKANNE